MKRVVLLAMGCLALATATFAERRLIIRPDMFPGKDGANINGPSLILAPSWLPNPRGRYYLYFAHHGGSYIRLAYADRLEGPWKIHEGGVLRLQDAPGAKGHIASPDVHVDDEQKEIRMYFHGPARHSGEQMTFVALSKDGVHFVADSKPLCPFYLRAFRWNSMWYGLAKSGALFRSKDGLTPFEAGGHPLPMSRDIHPRHVALERRGDTLWVYWSNIGDAPEHILRGRIRLTSDWTTWKAEDIQSVLRPEMNWEGTDLLVTASRSGAAKHREHALRDPYVFVDDDQRAYLLYAVAGESGIAITERP